MSSFSAAFLSREARALAFAPDDFRDQARRVARARRAAERRCASGVVDALAAQNPNGRALDALAGGAVAVVTGQQVGLFLGPLYAVAKAASAIAVAKALEAESGVRCVPVFWLQTEDHDLAEIDHLDVLTREGLERVRLESPHVPRASVGGLALGSGVDAALEQLARACEGPALDAVMAFLRRHYRPQARWSDAFARAMAELFPELLFVDPTDPALARAAYPVHQRAFAERESISTTVLARAKALEAAGFEVQVHVRPGAPLSFVHPDGPLGPRYRVEAEASGYRLVGDERRLNELSADPRCFSSSALLRPIVQDTLLPTAAVVLGPGELNYFAQVGPLAEHFGLELPLLVPRARFRIIEPKVATLLERLGLVAADVEAPRDAVLARLGTTEGSPPAELERALVSAVEPILSGVTGLDDAVARTRATIARAASRLAGRLEQRQRSEADTTLGRLERAQRALFPNGAPHERVFGFPQFAAKAGLGLARAMLDAVVPFSTAVHELRPLGAP